MDTRTEEKEYHVKHILETKERMETTFHLKSDNLLIISVINQETKFTVWNPYTGECVLTHTTNFPDIECCFSKGPILGKLNDEFALYSHETVEAVDDLTRVYFFEGGSQRRKYVFLGDHYCLSAQKFNHFNIYRVENNEARLIKTLQVKSKLFKKPYYKPGCMRHVFMLSKHRLGILYDNRFDFWDIKKIDEYYLALSFTFNTLHGFRWIDEKYKIFFVGTLSDEEILCQAVMPAIDERMALEYPQLFFKINIKERQIKEIIRWSVNFQSEGLPNEKCGFRIEKSNIFYLENEKLFLDGDNMVVIPLPKSMKELDFVGKTKNDELVIEHFDGENKIAIIEFPPLKNYLAMIRQEKLLQIESQMAPLIHQGYKPILKMISDYVDGDVSCVQYKKNLLDAGFFKNIDQSKKIKVSNLQIKVEEHRGKRKIM